MGMLVRVDGAEGCKLAKTQGDQNDLENHDRHWRKFFNINRFETKERRFGGRISTDGVSVSAYLDRDQACILSTHGGEWDPLRIGREKGGMPVLYGGVDPGFTDVFTVAHSDTLEGLKASVVSYSSSRYAEESKQKLSNRRTAKWNSETSDNYDRLIVESDRSDVDGLKAFIKVYLQELRPLLTHRASKGYRNMRFLRYVWKYTYRSATCATSSLQRTSTTSSAMATGLEVTGPPSSAAGQGLNRKSRGSCSAEETCCSSQFGSAKPPSLATAPGDDWST